MKLKLSPKTAQVIEECRRQLEQAAPVMRACYEQLRRCKATKQDGLPCQAWAVWGAKEQMCSSHLYPTRRKNDEITEETRNTKPRRRGPTCNCRAYDWPHRPGNGLCRWPDDPIKTCPTPGGSRSPGARIRRKMKVFLKKLRQTG